jgi:hypothetical protein
MVLKQIAGVESNALEKIHPSNRAELMAGVRSHLCRREQQPRFIRNLCQEKHVRYGAGVQYNCYFGGRPGMIRVRDAKF